MSLCKSVENVSNAFRAARNQEIDLTQCLAWWKICQRNIWGEKPCPMYWGIAKVHLVFKNGRSDLDRQSRSRVWGLWIASAHARNDEA